jgi:hypothetical protein
MRRERKEERKEYFWKIFEKNFNFLLMAIMIFVIAIIVIDLLEF